jgi:UDP-N-acetyl-2-amino-2-deoxyglucuronate dehydrogenase
MPSKTFALIGAAGFVAPRHMRAIKDTGNQLIAALDPNDSVGIIDSYFPQADFFTEFERFDRHIDKLRRKGTPVDYVSICSPNYLHDAHIRLALRNRAQAICEKPLVLNPWNVDALEQLEEETGQRVYTILQLRVHPSLIELKQRLDADTSGTRHQVVLTYITSRGPWYHYSWKGQPDKSGGVATNIGIHFFDLLMWLFGKVDRHEVHLSEPTRMAGAISLERADVSWFVSVDTRDLPFEPVPGQKTTYRSITVDGSEIEFTKGFTDLHTEVYRKTLEGAGFGLAEARPSIELVHRIRTEPVSRELPGHPLMKH